MRQPLSLIRRSQPLGHHFCFLFLSNSNKFFQDHLQLLQAGVNCAFVRISCRFVSSSPPRHDPFRVLGLPRGSSYQQVKERFVKLALQHHPDRQEQDGNSGGSNNAAASTSTENTTTFIQVRQAFEVIREGHNGIAQATHESQWSDDELRKFMEEQTSEFLSFKMDHETRQAVIQTVTNLSPGGLDRGGTWEMARMLAQREKCAPNRDDDLDAKQVSATAASSRGMRRRRR